MDNRLAVISRACGTRGPDVAHGLRIAYEHTSGLAVERAVREHALVLVLEEHPPSRAVRILERLRRKTREVAAIVLLRPPVSLAQEQALIHAGADAVAHYPLPPDAWSKLWRYVVERREPAFAAGGLPPRR